MGCITSKPARDIIHPPPTRKKFITNPLELEEDNFKPVVPKPPAAVSAMRKDFNSTHSASMLPPPQLTSEPPMDAIIVKPKPISPTRAPSTENEALVSPIDIDDELPSIQDEQSIYETTNSSEQPVMSTFSATDAPSITSSVLPSGTAIPTGLSSSAAGPHHDDTRLDDTGTLTTDNTHSAITSRASPASVHSQTLHTDSSTKFLSAHTSPTSGIRWRSVSLATTRPTHLSLQLPASSHLSFSESTSPRSAPVAMDDQQASPNRRHSYGSSRIPVLKSRKHGSGRSLKSAPGRVEPALLVELGLLPMTIRPPTDPFEGTNADPTRIPRRSLGSTASTQSTKSSRSAFVAPVEILSSRIPPPIIQVKRSSEPFASKGSTVSAVSVSASVSAASTGVVATMMTTTSATATASTTASATVGTTAASTGGFVPSPIPNPTTPTSLNSSEKSAFRTPSVVIDHDLVATSVPTATTATATTTCHSMVAAVNAVSAAVNAAVSAGSVQAAPAEDQSYDPVFPKRCRHEICDCKHFRSQLFGERRKCAVCFHDMDWH
eukprot:TRINITY_DN9237_c0_g1_i1.p1 TRINITY_DN9237_c0_g1~~TRINITY_DN9237_c0_g1_i1.p1  ORF type:complete len:549 (-),score=75.74 TRINITY_DN9237_c0_g1_i1:140-1786(-)